MSTVPSEATSSPSLPPAVPWRRILTWCAVLLAALGWWLSFDLTRLSAGGSASNPLLQSQCGPGSGGDCASLLATEWGKARILPGQNAPAVPTAALGLAYFSIVGVWFLLAGPYRGRGGRWHYLIVLLVGIGAWRSLDYVRVMAELGRWCGGCSAAHAINGLLLVVTVALIPWRARPTDFPTPASRHAIAALSAGAGLALLQLTFVLLVQFTGVAGALRDQLRAVQMDPDYVRWEFGRQSPVDLKVAADEPLLGNPAAPHTIVIFSDFQCAACRQAHETLQRISRQYPDHVRVAFRNYPLDSACNPHYDAPIGHPAACAAALTAEAAKLIGGNDGYLRMREVLYAEQNRLDAQPWEQLAAQADLPPAKLVAARDDAAALAAVTSDIELAHRLGIRAAPAIYLDGRRISGWSSEKVWDVLLADAGE